MGRPELVTDPRYIDNPNRVNNAESLDAEIAAWTRKHTLAELEILVADADIPSSRIFDMADIAVDEQFLARGMVQSIDDPRLGKVLHPGVVPRMAGGPAGKVRWTGPDIGQHNENVLRDLLGMSEAEIARMIEEGII